MLEMLIISVYLLGNTEGRCILLEMVVTYRKSRNFRVENISWGKFSCKIIFIGGDPLPYALAL